MLRAAHLPAFQHINGTQHGRHKTACGFEVRNHPVGQPHWRQCSEAIGHIVEVTSIPSISAAHPFIEVRKINRLLAFLLQLFDFIILFVLPRSLFSGFLADTFAAVVDLIPD